MIEPPAPPAPPAPGTPGTPAAPASLATYAPRARFFGPIPPSYNALNRDLLQLATPPNPELAPTNRAAFQAAATTRGLDQAVKVVPLPTPIPTGLVTGAIRGMEHLRDRAALTALRGGRATDLPRPQGGRLARAMRAGTQGVAELIELVELTELVEHIEDALAGSHLFVRSIKLDAARASTTAPSNDPAAPNLHFDAERSSLAEYAEPVLQFYLNAGRLERQFLILPVLRADLLAGSDAAERETLPFESLLEAYLAQHPFVLETIPVESGALAIFDGRQFAHDAGKADVEALSAGRFEPSSEPDLVIALDTVETGYHQGLYRPELPFFEDSGFPETEHTR